MKYLFLTMAITTLTICAGSANEGKDLLDKVKNRYATCSSYYCEGIETTISNMMGEDNPQNMEKKFTIRFQRPDLLRVDWISPSPMSFKPKVGSLFTKDGKYYGVPGYSQKVEEFKSLENGMGTYAGISGGATYMIPSLLMGKMGYFYDFTCKLGADSKINNLDCHTIELSDKKSGEWTLFVQKDTFAILKTKNVKVISVEESKKTMDEAMKLLKDKNIPVPQFPQKDYTIETTIDYAPVTFDQVMQIEEFEYKEK